MITDSEKLILNEFSSHSWLLSKPKRVTIEYKYLTSISEQRSSGRPGYVRFFWPKKSMFMCISDTISVISGKSFSFLLSALLLFMFHLKKKKKAIFIQKHFKSFPLNIGKCAHQQLPCMLYDRAALN